jgi:hypothetical protein
VPLEESVAIYERGESLKRRCEELLRQAEARVDKITTDASGRPQAPNRSTFSNRRPATNSVAARSAGPAQRGAVWLTRRTPAARFRAKIAEFPARMPEK